MIVKYLGSFDVFFGSEIENINIMIVKYLEALKYFLEVRLKILTFVRI